MEDFIRKDITDQRDQIIFGEEYNAQKYFGGIRSFDDLTMPQVNQLDDMDILDMDECQNAAPTIGEMLDFLRSRETDGWYIHGYCVSPDREDFRITFEGIGKRTPPSVRNIIDFSLLFRGADEFYVGADGLRCRYD